MVRGRGSGEPPWLHDVPRVPPTAACVHWPRNHAPERNCSTMQAHAVPGQDCNTNGRLSAILFCMYGLVVLESNTLSLPGRVHAGRCGAEQQKSQVRCARPSMAIFTCTVHNTLEMFLYLKLDAS